MTFDIHKKGQRVTTHQELSTNLKNTTGIIYSKWIWQPSQHDAWIKLQIYLEYLNQFYEISKWIYIVNSTVTRMLLVQQRRKLTSLITLMIFSIRRTTELCMGSKHFAHWLKFPFQFNFSFQVFRWNYMSALILPILWMFHFFSSVIKSLITTSWGWKNWQYINKV